MSAITIAKYETNKPAGQKILQRLAFLANEKGLEHEGRILQEAATSADPSSPQAKKRFFLMAAFYKFLDEGDPIRKRELERLLSKELKELSNQFQLLEIALEKGYPAELDDFLRKKAEMQNTENTAESKRETEVRAIRWLLDGVDETFSTQMHNSIIEAIARVIRKKGLAEEDSQLLGELVAEALMRLDLEQADANTNLPLSSAIRQFRKDRDMSEEQLAARLGVSANLVKRYEKDEATPKIVELALLDKLAAEQNFPGPVFLYKFLVTQPSTEAELRNRIAKLQEHLSEQHARPLAEQKMAERKRLLQKRKPQ